MKTIGIDARLYSQTGVGIYIRNLLYYLQKIPDNNLRFYIYLMKEDFSKVKFNDNRFVKSLADFKWHSFPEQTGFLKTINQDRLDLIHFTYFSYPIFYQRPFVATIHDVTPLLFKTGRASTKNPIVYYFKHLIFQYILRNQIHNAKAIITPTKSVKNQVVEIFGNKYQKKIFPIYEGVNHELIKTKENLELKKKFSKPFFIYIGNFYPHKNIESLIKAFTKIKENVQLILIGPKDFFAERLYRFIDKSIHKERFVFSHEFNYQDLVFFYKNASALIHPSLSEGFGLPVIEAAYFNLPIIASNINVFKEILGGQYLAFDPNKIEDLRLKIEEFLKNKPSFDYQKIINKFSFEKMTEKTLEIYKKNVE